MLKNEDDVDITTNPTRFRKLHPNVTLLLCDKLSGFSGKVLPRIWCLLSNTPNQLGFSVVQ